MYRMVNRTSQEQYRCGLAATLLGVLVQRPWAFRGRLMEHQWNAHGPALHAHVRPMRRSWTAHGIAHGQFHWRLVERP